MCVYVCARACVSACRSLEVCARKFLCVCVCVRKFVSGCACVSCRVVSCVSCVSACVSSACVRSAQCHATWQNLRNCDFAVDGSPTMHTLMSPRSCGVAKSETPMRR
jgi:hypothetical protein